MEHTSKFSTEISSRIAALSPAAPAANKSPSNNAFDFIIGVGGIDIPLTKHFSLFGQSKPTMF